MPSPDDSTPVGAKSAFHPDFLARLASQDEPVTAAEAAYGGGFHIVAVEGGYALHHFWDDPERGNEPQVLVPADPQVP